MTEVTRYMRSVEEIEETLKLAGISPNKLKNTTQVIYSNLKQRHEIDKRKKLKLLELNPHLVSCIEEGKELLFKGGKDGHIVLCSDTRTFEVKEADISDSLILVPGLKLSDKIKSLPDDGERNVDRIDVERIFHTYYEIRDCRPKVGELLTLLSYSSFKGVEYEKQIEESSLYDWDKLRENVQMSDEELRQALTDNLVANINGYYRLIAFEYEARALTLMLDFMEENSWKPDEINKEETYEALKDLIPRSVFDAMFDMYASVSPRSRSSEGNVLYAYDQEKVCRLLAKVLLAASPINAYDKFIEAWKIGAPEEMKPKEQYLNGLALIVWNSKMMRKDVISFPESNLPEDINERFRELFKAKEKWTVDEITPYISRLATKDTVNALLTKYARASTVNGVKYYCSKHGK